MHLAISTKDPTAVEVGVQRAFQSMYPRGDRLFVPAAFGWAIECFTGRYKDYQAIDAQYHDFEHTLQGTLCMARVLHGRYQAAAEPTLSERMFQLGIVAILLHDTGYLKKVTDREGTGAKYTVTHVSRSAEFAAALLAEKGFSDNEIKAVQNMIRSTGVNASPAAIPFQSAEERIAGSALVTADLLGQMAADDYVDKLPILYAEFAEAAAFSGDPSQFVASFKSAEDLIAKTPAFWQNFALGKLEHDCQGLYRFLNDPYPSGPNFYLERIQANLDRIKLGPGGRGSA